MPSETSKKPFSTDIVPLLPDSGNSASKLIYNGFHVTCFRTQRSEAHVVFGQSQEAVYCPAIVYQRVQQRQQPPRK